MTTITREHLELAAKAAGYELDWETDVPNRVHPFRGGLKNYEPWQPHEDPFDSWLLAADCFMQIDFADSSVKVWIDGGPKVINFGSTAGITAMEAVTLAAAEIGRAMG